MSSAATRPEEASGEDTSLQPRPKLLRRPPQQPGPPAMLPAATHVPSPSAGPAAPPSAIQPGWQDDSRFGLVLILAVLLINLALMAWLPRLHTVSAPPTPLTAFPDEHPPVTAHPSITTYARPQEIVPEPMPVFSPAVETQPAPHPLIVPAIPSPPHSLATPDDAQAQ